MVLLPFLGSFFAILQHSLRGAGSRFFGCVKQYFVAIRHKILFHTSKLSWLGKNIGKVE
jgi:hypothetical protein